MSYHPYYYYAWNAYYNQVQSSLLQQTAAAVTSPSAAPTQQLAPVPPIPSAPVYHPPFYQLHQPTQTPVSSPHLASFSPQQQQHGQFLFQIREGQQDRRNERPNSRNDRDYSHRVSNSTRHHNSVRLLHQKSRQKMASPFRRPTHSKVQKTPRLRSMRFVPKGHNNDRPFRDFSASGRRPYVEHASSRSDLRNKLEQPHRRNTVSAAANGTEDARSDDDAWFETHRGTEVIFIDQ